MTTIIRGEKYGFDFDGVIHKSTGIPDVRGYPETHHLNIQKNINISIIKRMNEIMWDRGLIEIISSSGSQDGIFDLLKCINDIIKKDSTFDMINLDFFNTYLNKEDVFQKDGKGEYNGKLIDTHNINITNGVLKYNDFILINTKARATNKDIFVFESDVIEYYDDSSPVLLDIIWKCDRKIKEGIKRKPLLLYNVVSSLDKYYPINPNNFLNDINLCFLKSCIKLLCNETISINNGKGYNESLNINKKGILETDPRKLILLNADPKISETLRSYINIAMNDFQDPCLRYICYYINSRFKSILAELQNDKNKVIVYISTIENSIDNHEIPIVNWSANSATIIKNLIITEINKLNKGYPGRIIGTINLVNFFPKIPANNLKNYILLAGKDLNDYNKSIYKLSDMAPVCLFDIITHNLEIKDLRHVFEK